MKQKPSKQNFLKSKDIVESHSNRLGQVEGRILGLKDKADILEQNR
jgi:hypothetical protein